MSKTSRCKFTSEFKAKVAIEAIKEQQTIEALSKKYDLHPTQINTWKKEFLSNSSSIFEKEGKGSISDDKEGLIPSVRVPKIRRFRNRAYSLFEVLPNLGSV